MCSPHLKVIEMDSGQFGRDDGDVGTIRRVRLLDRVVRLEVEIVVRVRVRCFRFVVVISFIVTEKINASHGEI